VVRFADPAIVIGVVIAASWAWIAPEEGAAAQVNAAEAEVRRVIGEVMGHELPTAPASSDGSGETQDTYGGLEQTTYFALQACVKQDEAFDLRGMLGRQFNRWKKGGGPK
jgi:hypothetical protein